MSDDEPFDIGTKLKQRLDITRLQKNATETKITELNNDLQLLLVKIPKRPRESMAEMEEKINSLEYKRSNTNITSLDEKDILKEINFARRLKAQLEEFNIYERKVQEKKGQLADLREAFKTTITAIDELEAALYKVKLASKLGCSATELKSISIEIDQDRIGQVIGKNGVTIKKLEERSLVSISIDSISGKMNLIGSEHNLNSALSEIDKITMAVNENVHVSSDMMTYFTTKYVRILSRFRKEHPEITIEAYRENGTILICGLPDAIARAKLDLFDIQLSRETKTLFGRESSIIVGKSGSTINRLVEKHQVNIEVSQTEENIFVASVLGPRNNIDNALSEIDEVLEANKDVTDKIVVNSIVRNTLLANSGAPIKNLQKECIEATREIGGGIQLNFEKDDHISLLIMKGRRAALTISKKLISKRIEKIHESLVSINVDPFIVPKIIGKGGETIKKLKNGNLVNIDVDKTTGRIVIQSQDDEEVKRVKNEITKLAAENQIERIELSPFSFKASFKELVRSNLRGEINSLVWMGLDEEASSIILRGCKENVKKSKTLVSDFLTGHYIEEIIISAEDEPLLLAGGSKSPIHKIQIDCNAELNVVRAKFIVVAKGSMKNVKAAVKRLKQFLHGCESNTVSRISATEQALGIVIGKNGSKRAQLEKDYEGVSLFIHQSNRITIRGPRDAVKACRINVIRLLSCAKIQHTTAITREQYAVISKENLFPSLLQGIPVQVIMTEDFVKIRGFYLDVRDAHCLLEELLTGIYKAYIEIKATQLPLLRGACHTQFHLQRIEAATDADVHLDLANNSIVITGKRLNVQKAKNQLINLLELLFPTEYAKIEISKPLQTMAGDARTLGDCAAISGATIYLDRDLNSIIIHSFQKDELMSAVNIMEKRIDKAKKLTFSISLENSESWLIPLIIGENGNKINTIRMESRCDIDISKADSSLTITGDFEEDVIKARESIERVLEEGRRQCAFVELPFESMATFLGNDGRNIECFAAENKVNVEKIRKEPNKVKITGDEQYVAAARHNLQEWIRRWVAKVKGKTISIDKLSIPIVLVKEKSVIAALKKEFFCEVEINKEKLTLTVRGNTDEIHQQVIEKIKQILAEDKEKQQIYKNSIGTIEASVTSQKEQKNSETRDGNHPDKSNLTSRFDDPFSTSDSRKDKTPDFSKRPVGLTIVEKDVSKPKNKKKSKIKNKTKDISDELTLQVGSSAGRSLFNLLVTESKSHLDHQEKHEYSVSNNVGRLSLLVNEEQWDSSTVSSAAIDSSDPDDETGRNVDEAKPYIKSASGFTIRV